MKIIISLISGFIFSIGLGISGMTQPQNVIGFLDLFGSWNPALAFVMIGAIGVHAITYFLITKRASPILDSKFYIPTNTIVDTRLILGSALFGVGWGLGGFCPGPALSSVATGVPTVLIFVSSMVAGMFIFGLVGKRK